MTQPAGRDVGSVYQAETPPASPQYRDVTELEHCRQRRVNITVQRRQQFIVFIFKKRSVSDKIAAPVQTIAEKEQRFSRANLLVYLVCEITRKVLIYFLDMFEKVTDCILSFNVQK